MKHACLLLVTTSLLVGCTQVPPSPHPLATPFQGLATDGKHYSMLDLSRGKVLLVVFLHADHKAALKWAEEFAPIAIKEATWLNALGVTTIPELDIPRWKMQHPDILPTIGDMDRRIMSNYKAEESISIAVIADGTWRGTFKLSSPEENKALADALTQLRGKASPIAFPPLEDAQSLLSR